MVDASAVVGRPAQASIPLIGRNTLPVLHRQTDHVAPLLMRATADGCHEATIPARHNDITFSREQSPQFVGLLPPLVIFSKSRRTHHTDFERELCRWRCIIPWYIVAHAGSPCQEG